MIQNTPTTHLSTYHDLKAINIARSFVAQTGGFFGADKAEMHQLELIAEEASAFIINTLQADKDQLFDIKAEPIDSGLRFYFFSKGNPIDEDNLPVYDTKDPENSSDGLEFFLLENLSDAMEFKNNGNDGWILIFEKRFRHFQPFQAETAIDEDAIRLCSKEKLQFSIATPQDAYGIIKLTYLTYRYSYGKPIFYYRKKLQEAIENKEIIIFIAKNEKGEIVLCSTYHRLATCEKIAESGMLMSQPLYRKNPALLRLTRMQFKYFKEHTDELSVVYANLVTAHTRSQRLVARYNYYPTALKLSIHDRANFIGIETTNEDRESLLYALCIGKTLEPTTIFIPKEHYAMSQKLLANFENVTLSVEESASLEATTNIDVEKHHEQKFAIVKLTTLGEEWHETLKATLKELKNDGLITIHLYIQADRALADNFEDVISTLGLFFSGFVMKTLHTWELLYTALEGQHFDFDSIELDDPLAVELKEYMRKLS